MLPSYMKPILFLLSFLVFTNAYAQTQDLIALAEGDFLGMNALFDEKGSLFGYVSVYDYGKVSDKAKKFEYVIMDKNLNPFANNTFEGDLTAGDYSGYMNFEGKIVLRPTRMDYRFVKKDEVFTPSSMVIDLKTNTIKRKVYYDYDHGTFKEMLQNNTWSQNRKEYKAEKKENGFNYISSVSEIKEGGFIVTEYEDHGAYNKNNRVMRFDENKKELWRFAYNDNGSKSASQSLGYLDKDEHYYYGLLRDRVKKDYTHYLLVLDMKTGKEVHKKEIPDPDELLPTITYFPTESYGFLDNDKAFDDKIVVVGRKYRALGFVGFTRLLIDKKTFAADLKMVTYSDFRPFVPHMNDGGRVNGYLLDPRDILFLKDGSVGLLFEKYKAAGEYNAQKTKDMVYVYTDKDFKVAGAKVLEKEKSKWQNSDYLFSQNLNNDKDVVFFYRDYQKDDETKDRNWNLFINTMIDGTFKQEMIPISSKEDYLIFPYIAKEGYILLQEFNKKAKYNKVRLERLNY